LYHRLTLTGADGKGGRAINLKSNRERFQKSHIIHERIHATCREASNV